ncbi:hypothetical protein BXT86_05755, partial [candidate division WOR-3 bacterium 4484_100]
TQLRAGVVRPEIIIPSSEEFYQIKKTDNEYKVIWGKNYGKLGRIEGSPFQGRVSSGTVTWLCDLVCKDGEKITVPCSNLMRIWGF